MKNFMEDLSEEIVKNVEFNSSITENGAIGYRTTGKALLDMNFKISSYRNLSDEEIVYDFESAYNEDKLLAYQWLFFVRDIREGIGERRLFRVIINDLVNFHEDDVIKLLKFIPEYGRWDDLIELYFSTDYDTQKHKNIRDYCIELIYNQLHSDIENMNKEKPISLLAKWLPSIKSTQEKVRKKAKHLYRKLMFKNEAEYRKTISSLRSYLDIVEKKMCSNRWKDIDYSKVPSKANLIYEGAFFRHDKDRRDAFLNEVLNSDKKLINSKVLYPHEIVHKYRTGYIHNQYKIEEYDKSLEALWKNLKDVGEISNTIVVRDGSASMLSRIDRTKVTALDISTALAIYFAQKNTGQFKDKFITFSKNPRLVNLSKCNSLLKCLKVCDKETEVSNTNIEKVFKLILHTAIDYNLSQDEIPKNILIISDMEFDDYTNTVNMNSLFKNIESKYVQHGFKLPRLIFWNVCSRTNTIPLTENELGVALVSGFSTNILKMIMSEELDPYKVLYEALMSERYLPIRRELLSA